jgi:hypothetical protein
VLAVEPGRTVTVRDLLSGEQRCVHEVRGSATLVARDAILARIVDHQGVSVFCGHASAFAATVRGGRGREPRAFEARG